MAAPVCGLRPVRAARPFTEKVPKPTKETDSPSFKEPVIAPIAASNARPAAAFERSVYAVIASIRLGLFIYFHLYFENFKYAQPPINSTAECKFATCQTLIKVAG